MGARHQAERVDKRGPPSPFRGKNPSPRRVHTHKKSRDGDDKGEDDDGMMVMVVPMAHSNSKYRLTKTMMVMAPMGHSKYRE